jgi:hypothetical protein
VLAAIDLDDQPRLEADKIEDVAIQRRLPFELQPFKLPAAQCLPQQVLGLRRVGAHAAGEAAMSRLDTLAHVKTPSLANSWTWQSQVQEFASPPPRGR